MDHDKPPDYIGSAAFTWLAGQPGLSGDEDGDGTADFQSQLTRVNSMVVADLVR